MKLLIIILLLFTGCDRSKTKKTPADQTEEKTTTQTETTETETTETETTQTETTETETTETETTQTETTETETASSLNKCSNPLTIEKISCVRHSTTYTGALSYITATTNEEKNDCIKKYVIWTGGCAYRFVAPWPNDFSLCASSTSICSSAKTAWQAELEKLGYQCSSNTELINEEEQFGGAISPSTPLQTNCSEINSFEPFMNN